MAIKTFKFNYECHEAEAAFIVDTDVFTNEIAKLALESFAWDYDKDNDPITEILKKYAMEAIRVATRRSLFKYMEGLGNNARGVISDFKDKEGFASIDGSLGLLLISVNGYEFDDDKLDYTVS